MTDWKAVAERYLEGRENMREIAIDIGVKHSLVRWHFIRMGVKRTDKKRFCQGCDCRLEGMRPKSRFCYPCLALGQGDPVAMSMRRDARAKGHVRWLTSRNAEDAEKGRLICGLPLREAP